MNTQHFTDAIPSDVIDQMMFGDTYVKMGRHQDGYVLWWSDGVANDWTEFYPSLSLALARLATLAAAAESDWQAGFTSGPADFAREAKKLFNATLSTPEQG